jgi:predicted ribosome quality control (RQC) complex YloA/Tae2 family protein
MKSENCWNVCENRKKKFEWWCKEDSFLFLNFSNFNCFLMAHRFSSLDLAAVTASLNKCIGMRVQNIYDLDRRTYLLKLAKPDVKQQLIIECGVRVHLTEFTRERPPVPSVFTMKLRKLLRTKRLEYAEQQALDRVLVLTFGSGDSLVRLVLEFYAAGNIILTDGAYNISALIRSYEYELPPADGSVAPTRRNDDDAAAVGDDAAAAAAPASDKPMGQVAVGHVYPMGLVRDLQRLSREQFDALADRVQDAKPAAGGEGKKKPKPVLLRDVLNDALEIGPRLVLHCIIKAGLTAKTPPSQLRDAGARDRVFAALQDVEEMLLNLKRGVQFLDGFIVLANDGTYDSITPLLLAQHADRKTVRFETFNGACDEFFSRAEAMKVEKQRQAKLSAVERTLESVRTANKQRLDALIEKQRYSERAATLMQRHVDTVAQALTIVNSAVANHLDWTELTQLVKEEKRRGNPVAQLIHELRLEKNEVVLMLYDDDGDQDEDESDSENDEDDDDDNDNDEDDNNDANEKDDTADDDKDDKVDEEDGKERKQRNSKDDEALDRHPVLVTIDLDLTAQANIGKLFEARRAAVDKHERTRLASQKALKSAERQAKADLAKVHIQAEVLAVRKRYWFEKFRWFISSDGIIVVGGHDAKQNELLVRRYLRDGDLFVHADMHGAAAVIIRRPTTVAANEPMPASTILQAGAFAVCHSGAWASKIVHGSWWVNSDQVSKQAPAGEYLVVGGFMIRGKKNFIEPQQLQMGFGVLFVIDDDSVMRRRQRAAERATQLAARGLAQSAGDDDDDVDDAPVVAAAAPVVAVDKRSAAASEVEKPTAAVAVAATPAADEDEESSSGADDDMFRIALVEDKAKTVAADSVAATQVADDDNGGDDDGGDDGGDDVSVATEQAGDSQDRSKVRLSARQRRLLKQGKDPFADEPKKPKPAPAAPKEKPLPPGKKGKMKRLHAKYAEQDEEDREMMRKLYGIQFADGEQPLDKEAADVVANDAAKAEAEAAAATAATAAAPAPVMEKRCYVCGETGHERAACPMRETASSASQKKEIAALMSEEGLAGGDSAAAQSSDEQQLEALISAPAADDALLFSLVCCAPWTATGRWKYKRKLVPGSAKRGKLVKDAVHHFVTNESSATQRELALIKAMDAAEMSQIMMGNASLAAVGGSGGAKRGGGKRGGGGRRK